MALFGFGKKKKQVPKEQSRSFQKLNRRAYPRYIVQDLTTSLGEGVEISKESLQLVSQRLAQGDVVDVKIEDEEYEAEVVRVFGNRAALEFREALPKELVQRYKKTLLTKAIEPKNQITVEQLATQKEINITRAIINLMLEIEDPNTNVSKFKDNIEYLEDLKSKILEMANSVEVAGRGRVEDVGSAITRLGFDTIKKVVYRYITYEVSLVHNELKFFKDFDLYNILFSAVFKKLAPLFNFKDIKNEGQSLLAMSGIGAFVLSSESDFLAKRYESPKDLFSFEARVSEYRECGYDMLEVDAIYFLKILGVFHYLYDGFVLSNYMLYPHYAPKHLKIELSQRKLRFAYVAYLSILAQQYVFGKDKRSGHIFFERLKRFGFEAHEAKEWFDALIQNINKRLNNIGIDKTIHKPVSPHTGNAIENILGSGVYSAYFISQMERFSSDADRLALSYEDKGFMHFVLEKILNADRFSFLQMPFCVVPCDILQDDELPLAMFEGFDLLVFTDIHRLPKKLMKDFERLWREFDGKIMATIDKGAMIEYEDQTLYELVKDQLVDFPSYHQSQLLHAKMVQKECEALNEFLRVQTCKSEEFKVSEVDLYGVVAQVLKRV